MKFPFPVVPAVWAIALLGGLVRLQATDAPTETRLSLQRTGPDLHLSWLATHGQPGGEISRPWFEIQFSADLLRWQPVGQRIRAAKATPGEALDVTLPPALPHGFYRVIAVTPAALASPGDGGAEVFGYGPAFEAELERLGQISPEAFAQLYPSGADYLPGPTWDPTTARFWDQFNVDPAVVNEGKDPNLPGYRSVDYRLNARELEIFRRLGFVVSERLGWVGASWDSGPSMGNAFYQLWYNDLPVFVSTDAILHAWHRTYDLMLEEIEERLLFDTVRDLLDAMSAQLHSAWATAGNGVLRESLLDADYLLAVARYFVSSPPNGSLLQQDARVKATLADIGARQLKQIPDFLGHCRVVDFSQFEVRGHYTHSTRLQDYFRCLMWLGRIDLPVAGGPFERCPGDRRLASPRELGTAIVLHQLLADSGAWEHWETLDRVIQAFVGWSESLTFPQLGGLLAGAGIHSLADVPDLATLERVQAQIADGNLGVQNIRSDAFFEPLSDGIPTRLPRSFLVFGQKFVPDSWVFSQTVFDSIQWTTDVGVVDVQRRVPSALDVAFAVLGNNQVVPDIVGRIAQPTPSVPPTHADRFRDGLPYQHNLAAARAVMDAQRPDAWHSNIYLGWLDTLRQLSPPTTDAVYPEVMRTRAWAQRTLNTQLGSWTQLRHDTILYAKQSYTSIPVCFYPAGFVEPRLDFWRRLESLATRTADLIEALPFPDGIVHSNQVAHLRRFAATVATLESLAVKELAQQPFSSEDELFIRNLMQNVGWEPFGSGRTPKYSGWYPALFYQPVHLQPVDPWAWPSPETYFHETYGAAAGDLIIADVHTDLPAPMVNDPGSVLHEAIAGIGLMFVAVDNGADRMVYAGPVLSHYELEVIGEPYRLNDETWEAMRMGWGPAPSQPIEGLHPPPWTESFLVPR